MKIEILKHEKNPLMKREESLLSVEHSGKATPSRADLIKEVAKKLKAKENVMIIDKIFTSTGKSQSSLHVFVYKKPDDIPKGKLEKMKARMEKKKREKPRKEEVKPKEAKEEPKPEEKPEGKDEKEEKPEKAEGEGKKEG